MGMYDQIKGININHKNFNLHHNNVSFQTKDLDCEINEYLVFNGELYQDSDTLNPLPMAKKLDHTGEISIYTDIKENGVTSWIEYDLIFEQGRLTDVVAHEPIFRRDHRDLSQMRPNPPSNTVRVEISVVDCDKATQDAMIELLTDEKINEIRDVLHAPTACILFPSKGPELGLGVGQTPRMLASVVQTLPTDNLEDGGIKTTVPNGDKVVRVVDEMWLIPGAQAGK